MKHLSVLTRLWFAWVCFFRVLVSGAFAARAWNLAQIEDTLTVPSPVPKVDSLALSAAPALQLLALLQREGRLVDFLKQDIAAFSDNEVGTVARVVHAGCRKALESHVHIDPIRAEPEGDRLELPRGFDASEVKLTGRVQGEAPYKGVLRHRGWRATELDLPVPLAGHNPSVLAPAEVEL